MRTFAGCLALGAVLTLGTSGMPAGKSADADADRLIRQLGSRKYAERAAATRQLETLGEPALPGLRRAILTADLEVQRRAEALRARIEQQAEATRLLTGKRIRLVYRDTPIPEAIADLAARTGLDVRLDDEAPPLGKITLDTGATTAWDALRQVCQKARLFELASLPSDALAGEIIRLSDTEAKAVPTHLAGAVRVRALPLVRVPGAPPLASGFTMEASPEPGMPWLGVVDVRLTRAVDEHGQELKQPSSALGTALPLWPDRPLVWDAHSGQPLATRPDQRTLPVWLTAGKQPASRLREVEGQLILKLPVARQLVAVDHVLQAKGKTFNGRTGQSLTVLAVTRTAETLRLRVQIQADRSNDMGFQVVRTRTGHLVMRGGQGRPVLYFTLQDAAGASVRPQASELHYLPRRFGGLLVEADFTFALKPGQAVADRLVCYGPVATLLEVPFMLRNVVLTQAVLR